MSASSHISTCKLATEVQVAVFSALQGQLVRNRNCPNIDDLVNDFVDAVAKRIDQKAREVVERN